MPIIIPDQCKEILKSFRTSGDYALDAENDFRMIEKYIPERVESIVDIGCGLAGIDVFLKRKFPMARLMLVDSDTGPPYYNFESDMPPYGNREATEALLLANGIHDAEWVEADTFEADLIISTLAWGFHFPLSTYKATGYCIADLRRAHEQPRGTVIHEAPRHSRCAWSQ